MKPPDQELTATPILYPFRGSFKRSLQILDDPVIGWAAVLWLVASITGLWLAAAGSSLPALPVLLMLALIAGIAERESIRLFTHRGTNLDMSVAFLPFVFTAVAFGPLAAFIVGVSARESR